MQERSHNFLKNTIDKAKFVAAVNTSCVFLALIAGRCTSPDSIEIKSLAYPPNQPIVPVSRYTREVHIFSRGIDFTILGELGSWDTHPQLSLDCGLIVFQRVNNQNGIIIVDLDNRDKFFNSSQGLEMYPNISQDCEIAFLSSRDGTWDLFVMDRRGENTRQITYDNKVELQVEWLDNKRLSFQSCFQFEINEFCEELTQDVG